MLSLLFKTLADELGDEARGYVDFSGRLTVTGVSLEGLHALRSAVDRQIALQTAAAADVEPASSSPKSNFWDDIKTCAQLGAALSITDKQFSLRLGSGQNVSVVALNGLELLKALEVDDLTTVYLDFWAEKLGLQRKTTSDQALITQINQETVTNYRGERVSYTFVRFDADTMINPQGVLVNQDRIMLEAIVTRLSAKAREKDLANADEIALSNLSASRKIYAMFNKAKIHKCFNLYWFWSEILLKGMKSDGPLGLASRLSIEDIRNGRACVRYVGNGRWNNNGLNFRYGRGGAAVLFPQDSK